MPWPPGLARATDLLAVLLALTPAAPAAAGDFAFVTNQNSSELSVIDLEARRELRRVPVPGNPAGVAVGAGGAVYTVSPESKTVRRFDAGALAAETVLDGGPIGIAVDGHTDRVFVSDWYNARIWVLDGESLALEATLETGSAPAGLAIHGRRLAAADRDANQVSFFDIDSLAPLGAALVGERPFGIGFAPDGVLWACNVGSDDVTLIDPETLRALATVPVGDRPYGVAFAAGRAFVSNQYADTVSVIDLETRAPIAVLDVGEYPEGIDVTRDKRTVVVANWFSNSISLIDAAGLEVVGEIDTGDGPRAFGKFVTTGEGWE
ncbi:40-residue YVTN family beta-propeller repeat-containing protein [Poseidonocella sedimentorum]|uniref:40-residue YVTN family beta-propeller repeat-containing protein n=1 Tax=Poseidonocella sedimentorum TaxID=871652 RepID=A0A1I6D3X7_9RHOB|nr:40-residue YVTN family beta-propeller repeat-containing protein [Poseidonocella sedimentorum]